MTVTSGPLNLGNHLYLEIFTLYRKESNRFAWNYSHFEISVTIEWGSDLNDSYGRRFLFIKHSVLGRDAQINRTGCGNTFELQEVVKENAKLSKRFPDHLQEPTWILITECYEHKNLLITQHKLARVAPCFLKHGFARAFWRSRMQRTRLSPLVRSGDNHHCCKLCGVLEHALQEVLSFRKS